jgi:hypothetical protein
LNQASTVFDLRNLDAPATRFKQDFAKQVTGPINEPIRATRRHNYQYLHLDHHHHGCDELADCIQCIERFKQRCSANKLCIVPADRAAAWTHQALHA